MYSTFFTKHDILKKALIIALILLYNVAYPQSHFQHLSKLLDSTRRERNDSIRIFLNKQFHDNLKDVISSPSFVSDSIRNLRIGQLHSPDGIIIFYNWNIQQNDGTNIYNALAYLPQHKKLIELPEKSSEAKIDVDSVYAPNDWPGALYYKLIEPRTKTDKFYTLLAWDRFSRQTARKTIEAVTLVGDSALVFGKNVFKTKEGRASRVLIEYASTASLTLNYSKQNLRLTGVRRSQSKVNDSIIVVDRLAPLNEELKNIRWAYVPVGNIYDGYVFFKGYWTFVEGINARNPSVKKEDRKREKKPDMDLLPKK